MSQPAAVLPSPHLLSKSGSKQGSIVVQIMELNKTFGVSMKRGPKADQSAMGAIHRPLRITRLVVNLHKL